ncbi:retinol dehydrogenase 10-like [Discoglossus pictus]
MCGEVCWYIGLSVLRWILSPYYKVVAGDICLITGSAGGTGRQFALEFAKKGAILVLWDIDKEGNEDTAREVRHLGSKAYVYTCDVSCRESVYKTAERVKTEVGDVTILINNAVIVAGKSFLQCDDQLLEKILKTNSHAHFWTVKAFLPRMIELDSGHIITVASYLGLVATAYMEDFCASQFAAVGFHESLSHQLKATRADGVKTTLICPYIVNMGGSVRSDLAIVISSLTPEHCARQAMKGILTDQRVICMPRLIYLAAFLKHLLPWEAQMLYYKFLGLDTSARSQTRDDQQARNICIGSTSDQGKN